MGRETGEAFQKEAVGPIPNERGAGDGAHTPWHLRDQNGATQPCVQHQLLPPAPRGAPSLTDSAVGSPPFPWPTQYTAFRLCGVCDAPGTPASGALPDRFHGPAEQGSDALCSVQLPRSPMCVATLLPRMLCPSWSRGLSPVSWTQSRLPTGSIANTWPTAGAQ